VVVNKLYVRMAPSAATEANRYMSFTVLGIVASVVSLINSLGGIVRVCRTKAASHFGEVCHRCFVQ